MKALRGNPGLKGQLIENSIDAYVTSLEIINRLSMTYRVQLFCMSLCNAWELLLKAKILADNSNNRELLYDDKNLSNPSKKRKYEARNTISLHDCINKVLVNQQDLVRLNLLEIVHLRNQFAHFVVKSVPADFIGLFQACVINYHHKINVWFGVVLSERFPTGMMNIVYDLAIEQTELIAKKLRRQYGKETADFLTNYTAKLHHEYKDLLIHKEFIVSIEYKLALIKNPDEADIILTNGTQGKTLVNAIAVPKDSTNTHPYLQKDVIEELNKKLPITINRRDIDCINIVYKIKPKNNFYYQHKLFRQGQYSDEFVDWVVTQFNKDQLFFSKVREQFKQISKGSKK
jgi:hypothetical protein